MLKLNRGLEPINMVLVLIGFCHIFKVEYHPEVHNVMEFLQEKHLGISERKTLTMAYMNLRAVSCLEALVHVSQDDHNNDHNNDHSSDFTTLDPLETQFSIV